MDPIKAVLPGLVVLLALGLGSHTRAARINEEYRLRPTLVIHATLCVSVVMLTVILWSYWRGVPDDQLGYLYGLLVFICLCIGYLLWFFYYAVIYWNQQGVGRRTPLSSAFIPWDSVTRAGSSWDGSFVISSKQKKIRYLQFHGGHEQLNADAKRFAPAGLAKD